MNTQLTEHEQEYNSDWKEKIVEDYYADYYPNSRTEKVIFKYLDDLYYVGDDDVFFTIYRKDDDWFINGEDIAKEIEKLFGLGLPDEIKIGDEYIQPARNPIPNRIIKNWVKHYQQLHTKETLSEHKESKINPELKVDDIVRIIDVDGEHGRMPERFKTYRVVRVGKTYPLMTMRNRGHREYYDIVPYPDSSTQFSELDVKSLYRGDTWIYGDIPMANNVDRKTINENKKTKLNPELKIGDEIIVVDVGGTKEYINPGNVWTEVRPDKYIRYFVTKIYGNKELDIPLEDVPNHLFDTPEGPHYYGLNRPNVDVTDPDNPGVFDRSSTHKYLYPGIDTWMFNPKEQTMRYEDAFDSDHYLSDKEYEELYGDDGQDEYGGYPDLIPETKKEKIREHTENRLNPELEEGDTILIVDRRPAPPGIREPFPEHEPELFTTYVVTHKVNTGHKATHPYHYFLLPEEEYEIFINDPQNDEVDIHEKSLFPWIHDWILDKEDLISEHKKSNLNPELMVGDEIIVVSTEGIHDFGAPELYKPYVVVGLKHGTTMNREIHKWTHDEDEEQTPDRWDSPEVPRSRLGFRKEFDTIPYTYYQIEPIGMTDEERTGAMLAGGGRMKPMYIFPSPSEYRGSDQWILRPGFLRGEHLTEHKEELNQPLSMGDVIRVVDVDKDSTYEQPKYPYDTGNASGNSLMKDHYRGQIHGEDTYPKPMGLYGVMSKSRYRPQDRDYLNPYWMLWPVDDDGKLIPVKDFHEIILTDKDTWMTVKKHHSNIPGDIEAKHKEYVDSGRDIISRQIYEALNDLVYRDEPRDKHTRRMNRDLGSLEGFPIERFKNMPPPSNESNKTEEEIGYLEEIPVDKNLVDSADEISNHFRNFLSPKGLEYPKQGLKEVMQGVKSIILQLKYHYNRPRPWQIAQAKGLELNSETLESSSSPSYPSGHATQGRFVARYLSDLYPEYRDEIMQIGEDIAYSRNMAKVHYPTDSAFGKFLADEMYEYVYEPQQEPEMELDEYCPMGKPNKCKEVNYETLPDMVHESKIQRVFKKVPTCYEKELGFSPV